MLYRAGWVADAGVRLVTVAHPRGVHRRVDPTGCGGIILVAVGDVGVVLPGMLGVPGRSDVGCVDEVGVRCMVRCGVCGLAGIVGEFCAW